MKLLLVNPYFKSFVVVPSLGLGFIATYIKNHSEWEAEVIEPILQGLNEKETLDKVRGSDILGLVCYTESRFSCFDFAKKVKIMNPNCKIVIGGPHVNTLDEYILNYYSFIDLIVRSEGEETLLEIVKGKPLEGIKGITYRRNGKIIRNPYRNMIADIDNLYLDYSLYLPWIENWKDYEVPYHLKKIRHLPIIASRGCPFHCTFCAANQNWGKIWRGLTPERLVNWMKNLVRQYNVGYFRFYDSLFIGRKEKTLEFCGLLEKENLKVSFRIDIRAGTARYVLERLRKVGCDIVGFGIESGSDRILNRINKGINRKVVEETVKICRELGFWLIGYFMVSLPSENMRDIKKTYSLFKYFDVLNVQFFKVYPDTTFYDELKLKREIDDSVWFNPNVGLQTEWGNQIYYCKEVIPRAKFCYQEVNLITSYLFEIDRLKRLLKTHGLIGNIRLFFRLIAIKLILKSETILRFYLRLKDNCLIKTINGPLRSF